jgi:ribosomal protein S18 acetylase RimI-like enzyme
MARMSLSLRPMTPAEFESLIDTASAAFLAEMVATGQLRLEDVPAEARRRREQIMPNGLETEHMLLFIGEVDGEAIGWMWLALPGAPHHAETAWVYNVEIDEAQRGKGYGKAMMLAAERELVQRGVTKLGLNVFGSNKSAIGLYERLGYEVISQQMTKPLSR